MIAAKEQAEMLKAQMTFEAKVQDRQRQIGGIRGLVRRCGV